LSHIFDDKLKL